MYQKSTSPEAGPDSKDCIPDKSSDDKNIEGDSNKLFSKRDETLEILEKKRSELKDKLIEVEAEIDFLKDVVKTRKSDTDKKEASKVKQMKRYLENEKNKTIDEKMRELWESRLKKVEQTAYDNEAVLRDLKTRIKGLEDHIDTHERAKEKLEETFNEYGYSKISELLEKIDELERIDHTEEPEDRV